MDWIFRLFVRWLPDQVVQQRYVRAGAIAGESLSYVGIGMDIDLMSKIKLWGWWEKVYAARGYRPLSEDLFIDYGAFNIPLEGLGERILPDEPVLFFAPDPIEGNQAT